MREKIKHFECFCNQTWKKTVDLHNLSASVTNLREMCLHNLNAATTIPEGEKPAQFETLCNHIWRNVFYFTSWFSCKIWDVNALQVCNASSFFVRQQLLCSPSHLTLQVFGFFAWNPLPWSTTPVWDWFCHWANSCVKPCDTCQSNWRAA